MLKGDSRVITVDEEEELTTGDAAQPAAGRTSGSGGSKKPGAVESCCTCGVSGAVQVLTDCETCDHKFCKEKECRCPCKKHCTCCLHKCPIWKEEQVKREADQMRDEREARLAAARDGEAKKRAADAAEMAAAVEAARRVAEAEGGGRETPRGAAGSGDEGGVAGAGAGDPGDITVECDACRRKQNIEALTECSKCGKLICSLCMCTCSLECTKCRRCCLRDKKAIPVSPPPEDEAKAALAREKDELAGRLWEAEAKLAASEEIAREKALKKEREAQLHFEERLARELRARESEHHKAMAAEERRVAEVKREADLRLMAAMTGRATTPRGVESGGDLFNYSSGDEISRILEREKRERKVKEEEGKRKAEFDSYKELMTAQMEDFRKLMSGMQEENQKLRAELAAERTRAAKEARAHEERMKEERARSRAEDTAGMTGAGRAAGVFEGEVREGKKGKSKESKERIVGLAGAPPRELKEAVGKEESHPMRAWRTPAAKSEIEVRYGEAGLGARYEPVTGGDDESGESSDEESVGRDPSSKDPLERFASVMERQTETLVKVLAKRGGGEDEDLLHYGEGDDDDGKYGGARGLTAFEGCYEKWLKNPGPTLKQVDDSAKRLLGVRAGSNYRLPDVIPRLPFASYNTKKRAFLILAEAGEALLQNKPELARGIIAQGIRWISLSLIPP